MATPRSAEPASEWTRVSRACPDRVDVEQPEAAPALAEQPRLRRRRAVVGEAVVRRGWVAPAVEDRCRAARIDPAAWEYDAPLRRVVARVREHVVERIADLRRCRQLAGVIAPRDHGTATPEAAVDRLGEASTERLHAEREPHSAVAL